MIGTDRLVAQSIAAAAASPATAAIPTASAGTRAFKFSDPANWTYRTFLATVADNTPDAQGLRHYYDVHSKSVSSTVTTWGYGTVSTSKDDLHWSGSAWLACPLGTRGTTKALDASGLSYLSNYCDRYTQNSNKRALVDIAGKTMTEVVSTIRAVPGSDAGGVCVQPGNDRHHHLVFSGRGGGHCWLLLSDHQFVAG